MRHGGGRRQRVPGSSVRLTFDFEKERSKAPEKPREKNRVAVACLQSRVWRRYGRGAQARGDVRAGGPPRGKKVRVPFLRSPLLRPLRPSGMAAISVNNIAVLNNPAPFLTPLKFEITFEAHVALEADVDWTVYGSK